MIEHSVYFSLGANIGHREDTIARAIELIGERVGTVTAQSSLLETAPWGFTSSHPFLNACICCSTRLSPFEVLAVTQQIERELGRTTKSVKGVYHDRTIDIDILLYNDLHLEDERLQIPHPHMKERDFMMVPLREIYPNY